MGRKIDLAEWRIGKIRLVLRHIYCGKANCSKCPHGPYWYIRYRRNGRPFSRYLGRSISEAADGLGAREAERIAAKFNLCDRAVDQWRAMQEVEG